MGIPMKIEMLPIDALKPYEKNPRKNTAAIGQVVKSLGKYGWRQPIVVDKDMIIVVGHTRLLAAKKLKMKQVPVHIASDMSAEDAKAYRIMDNRSSEFAEWDKEFLIGELTDLADMKFDIELTGFDLDFLGTGILKAAAGNEYRNEDHQVIGEDDRRPKEESIEFEYSPPSDVDPNKDQAITITVTFESLGDQEALFLELRDRGFKVKA